MLKRTTVLRIADEVYEKVNETVIGEGCSDGSRRGSVAFRRSSNVRIACDSNSGTKVKSDIAGLRDFYFLFGVW